MQVRSCNRKAALYPLAFDFDTNDVNPRIDFAKSFKKFDGSYRACSESEVDDYRLVFANDWQRCDKSIDAAQTIRVCRSACD